MAKDALKEARIVFLLIRIFGCGVNNIRTHFETSYICDYSSVNDKLGFYTILISVIMAYELEINKKISRPEYTGRLQIIVYFFRNLARNLLSFSTVSISILL
jgi:hypothetical protein